jgi:hypothetical protein
MKMPILRWVMFWLLVATSLVIGQNSPPASGKVTLKLITGETMTGTVGGVRDGSVSLITDYGPVRVPVEKLAEETKTKLGISDTVDVESLRVRVRELEDLVARLREENVNLRQAASTSRPATAVQPATEAGVRASPPAADGVKYRMSSSGKRHNSRCRYFSSQGRDCGPSDGVACKVCGG